jgi:hypothetical protein
MIDRMESTLPPTASSIRTPSPSDAEACVSLWVAACAARDGTAFPGVAERARAKFGRWTWTWAGLS